MAEKTFNITGPCVPALHYMVDTSTKIQTIISEYINKGCYFTINRARQYGKTTTLGLLKQRLENDYIVIPISFEGFGADVFSDEKMFFKYASAYLLRGARHASHDMIHLRTSAIRRRLYLGRRLDSHQD